MSRLLSMIRFHALTRKRWTVDYRPGFGYVVVDRERHAIAPFGYGTTGRRFAKHAAARFSLGLDDVTRYGWRPA